MLPSEFFRRNVVLSFQEDAIGIRLRDVIGVDKMMWGSDYPHSESTFPQSRKILAVILEGVPDDEQAKIAGGNTARVYNFDVARLTVAAGSAVLPADRRGRRARAVRRGRALPLLARRRGGAAQAELASSPKPLATRSSARRRFRASGADSSGCGRDRSRV